MGEVGEVGGGGGGVGGQKKDTEKRGRVLQVFTVTPDRRVQNVNNEQYTSTTLKLHLSTLVTNPWHAL